MINSVGLNKFDKIPQEYNKKIYNNTYRKSGLKCDTVSFKSRNLLQKSSEEITNIVISAIKDSKNKIGMGSEGTVYSIPDTEYCVKVLHRGEPEFTKWDLHVNQDDAVNHVVATSGKNVSIMKKIKGEELIYGQEPKEIYSLPDATYRNLFLQIKDAHRKYMVFDSVPRNIIYDKENQTLTAIDFIKENRLGKYGFSPFYDVYDCLRAKGNTSEDKNTNKKFAEKLFSIACNEFSVNNGNKIPVIKNDIDELYSELVHTKCNSPQTDKYKEFLDEKINAPKPFSLFSYLQSKIKS